MGKGTRLSSSSTINGDILGLAFNGQSMSLRVCNAKASRIPTKGMPEVVDSPWFFQTILVTCRKMPDA